MLKFVQGLIRSRLDYTTRHHLKALFRSLDYRFIGAVAVLLILTLVVMKLY